MYELYHGMRPN